MGPTSLGKAVGTEAGSGIEREVCYLSLSLSLFERLRHFLTEGPCSLGGNKEEKEKESFSFLVP